MTHLINVSNRLPITLTGTDIVKSSGGLVSALESFRHHVNITWIGWPGGFPPDDLEKDRLTTTLRSRFNFEPVFLTEEEVDLYYNGFSNSSLWPLLHYMIPYSHYEERWYQAYQRVNRLFAETIVRQAAPGDVVWVHDYHLMLVPSMVRELRPDLKIGFFLHTPFPSSEAFRCNPNREQLLHGLLGADLIGFHTFGYVGHFRNTLLRVLGLESEMNSIVSGNHRTMVHAYPIGIDSQKFLDTLASDACRVCLSDFRNAYRNKKIVLSVERLDYTKGILRRLKAIKSFLARQPDPDDVVFLFISVPSREEVDEYKALLDDVLSEVSHINGKFSTIKNVPLHFIHKSVNFVELCALYSLADVCIVTPAVDGMNLVAKEYVACQNENPGVLILSEFAGAAQELSSALIVNPYNINQVSESIETALSMPEAERAYRIDAMRTKVLRYDARHWGERFLADLDKAAASNTVDSPQKPMTVGDLPPFSPDRPLALFLDYDGTLSDLRPTPAEAAPDEALNALLSLLDSRNDLIVSIISGRSRSDMATWFSRFDFNLIAEHGYYIRHKGESSFRVFDERADLSWMEQIGTMLNHYAGVTPGSSVEVKSASIVWHYRQSDPEYGLWKANQLVSELSAMMSNRPVEIHHGKKIVEVSSIQINKGCTVERFLEQHKDLRLVCAGDDVTDESMFRITDPRITHIKVGPGETTAPYRIDDPAAFRQFLRQAFGQKKAPEKGA
jgi:trehalose 6-phosphate synthase/phosphatase